MNKRERERITAMYYRLSELDGFTFAECETLRKASMILSRWGERECNGEIERDETTGKLFHFYDVQTRSGWQRKGYPVPDRETGAKKRIQAIINVHPGFDWYYQTDPRGAAVYIYRHEDVTPGVSVECSYSSIGIAVY